MSEEKNVLITGAGSWIGRGIALQLSHEGWYCYLVGKNETKLSETQKSILEAGGKAEVFSGDVTSLDAMQGIANQIKKLDALVCNAAIYPTAAIEDITLAQWREVIDVNLNGGFICLKAFLQLIKKSTDGRVVFISSIAGKVAAKNLSHYCASKAGVIGLMRSAAVELAKYGITVNAISPGNMVNKERFGVTHEQVTEMLKSIPVGRTGVPNDVAGLLSYLVSEKSSFLTGQDFIIDGGELSL